MSIRDDLIIDWAVGPRIIEVADPSTALTVQDLYDTLRDKSPSSEAIDETEIIDGSGKEDLGEGVLVGLTVRLLNAQVRFEEKASPTVCTISGGNLVAVDENGDSMCPIASSANVTVILAQSTSASLIEGTGITEQDKLDIADRVAEHQTVQTIQDYAELAAVT